MDRITKLELAYLTEPGSVFMESYNQGKDSYLADKADEAAIDAEVKAAAEAKTAEAGSYVDSYGAGLTSLTDTGDLNSLMSIYHGQDEKPPESEPESAEVPDVVAPEIAPDPAVEETEEDILEPQPLTPEAIEEADAPIEPEEVEPEPAKEPYPSATMMVPQGALAHENVKDADNIVKDEGSEVKQSVFIADNPAFHTLMKSMQAVGLSKKAESEPQDIEGIGSLMGTTPGSDTSSNKLSPESEVRHLKNAQAAWQQLQDEGYGVEGINYALKGEIGLVPATSPFEIVAAGIAGPLKLGGTALLKSMAPVAATVLPFDIGLTVATDEIAQDNWLLGLGLGIVGGMGLYQAGIKMGQFDAFVASKILPKNFGPLDASWLNPKGGAKPFGTTGSIGQTKAYTRTTDTIDLLPSPSVVTKAASLKVATEASVIVPTITPQLYAKTVKLRAAQVEKELNSGEFTSSETRKAAQEIIATAQEFPAITPEQTTKLVAAQKDLAEPKALGVTKTQDNPFIDNGSSVVTLGSAKYRVPITAKVKRDWFGPVTIDRNKIVEGVAAQMAKDDPELASSVVKVEAERLVENRIQLGMYGEDFVEDFGNQYNRAIEQLTEKGEDIDVPAVRAQVREDLYQEYLAGVNEEVEFLLANGNYNDMGLKTFDYIEGGTVELDAKFMSPSPAGVGIEITQSSEYRTGEANFLEGYKAEGASIWRPYNLDFKDWDIHKQFRPSDIADRLELKPEVGLKATQVEPNNNQPKISFFKNLDGISLREARTKAFQFKNYWYDNKRLKWPKKVKGKTGRPVFPEAEKLKERGKLWKRKEDRVEGEPDFTYMQVIPNELVESVARMLGWNDDRVVGTHNVNAETGKLYQSMAEDVVVNKDLYHEYEALYPGYFESQSKLPVEQRDPKYYKYGGAEQVYTLQRENYIREVLSMPKRGEEFPSDQAKKDRRYYYSELDKLAVMHSEMMKDIRQLEGSLAQSAAKRMYILVGDVLAGTTRTQDIANMQRANVRAFAWGENQKYIEGERSDFGEDSIAQLIDEFGLTAEEATALHAQQVEESLSPIGPVSDTAGTPMSGQEVGTTGVDQDLIDLRQASLPQLKQGQIANISSAEKYAITQYANQIEDFLGTRVIDPFYTMGEPGTKARVNLFKVNTPDDVWRLVEETSSRPDLLVMISPEKSLGIIPSTELSKPVAAQMTKVAMDLDDQIRPAAQALLRDPENVVKAIAFEKARVTQSLVLTALTKGRMGSQAKQAIRAHDFMAHDDYSMVNKLGAIVEENYAIYSEGAIDTRMVNSMADIYDSHFSVADRVKWASEIADVYENTGYMASNRASVKARVELTKLLKEACD